MPTIFWEPTLRDLLDDPLTWVMMRRDGVSREALLSVIRTVAAKRAASGVTMPPPSDLFGGPQSGYSSPIARAPLGRISSM